MAVKFTPKQQMVINQLLINPSLKLCSEVTGLSYIYIRQLHTKSYILDALEQGRKRVAEKAEVDAAWVLQQQVRVFDRCMQDEPVLDGEGNPTGIFRFNASGALRALENIGKHCSVDAFVRNGDDGKVDVPASGEWTVRVVHVSKADYERSIGNGKPPIEHQS